MLTILDAVGEGRVADARHLFEEYAAARDEAIVRASGVCGSGVGRRLVEQIISEARSAGYERMRLDSLSSMVPALALYRQFGFRDIPSYRENPIHGSRFLELLLDPVLSDS
jgi:ribosomal protein S18 acetylase RimI-like enzyme